MSFVYILKNKKGEFYIGSTLNLETRMRQHIKGSTFTTKRMQTFDLVLSQKYKNVKEARSVELKLKKLKRHDYLAKMVREGFIRIKP